MPKSVIFWMCSMNIAVKLEPSIARQLQESTDHIVVTGATGWLGRAFIEAIADAIGVSRLHAFASVERVIELRDGIKVFCEPISEITKLPIEHTYKIFHFAFLTKDKQSNMSLEHYVERNIAIRSYVSEALSVLKVSGLCVTSSGAVYTKTR